MIQGQAHTLVNFESAQPSQSDQFSVGVNSLECKKPHLVSEAKCLILLAPRPVLEPETCRLTESQDRQKPL